MDKEIFEITKRFHDTYEKLSKEYSYETREDTKIFNINSNNGMLMYATVNEIVSPILQQLKEKDEVINKAVRYIKNNLTIVSILDGKEEYGLNNFKFDYKDLLQILEDKEVK